MFGLHDVSGAARDHDGQRASKAGPASWPDGLRAGRHRAGAGLLLGHHEAAWPFKGAYQDAYVMIDIRPRYLVGVHVHHRESGPLAEEMMRAVSGIHSILWSSTPNAAPR